MIEKYGIAQDVLSVVKFKQHKHMMRVVNVGKKRVLDIEKLEDANDAGSNQSQDCTLIVTQGDSAKALAVAGLEVLGRDKFGVYPIRGKFLNIRNATSAQIKNNKEIKELTRILGLHIGTKYETKQELKQLRYGHLMIMADQDVDGAHIKGLLINFVHHFWPALIRQNYLMLQFITPLLKSFYKNEVRAFFTLPQYNRWIQQQENPSKWKTKYYKGLGTSTSKQAQEYFEDLDTHRIQFVRENEEDQQAIKMAFTADRVDQRKEWILGADQETLLEYGEAIQHVSYKDFVYKDLVHYGVDNLIRCIPSMCDGLKQSQRKILFGCFKRNLHSELKVAQLAGYISQVSEYHHGEEALKQTIIKMAQNFVGSNNISLILPIGQFGTRHMGGNDHASGRYIFTSLSKITRALFHPEDDQLLTYRIEDGKSVEPNYYLPILPLVLINGAQGVGLGWSTSITKFNPRDIAAAFLNRLEGIPFKEFVPWFKGWSGKIWKHFSMSFQNKLLAREAYQQFKDEMDLPNVRAESKNEPKQIRRYDMCGQLEMMPGTDRMVKITQLPVGMWTQQYKKFLKSKIVALSQDKENTDVNQGGKLLQFQAVKEYHTTQTIEFHVSLTHESYMKLKAKNKKDIKRIFRLNSYISISNMTLFGLDGKIKEYSTPQDLSEQFFHLRRQLYQKRYENQLKKLKLESLIRENKFRFIQLVNDEKIVLRRKTTQECIDQLKQNQLLTIQQIYALFKLKLPMQSNNAMEGYNYLLTMKISNLTEEMCQILQKQLAEIQTQIGELLKKTSQDLWKKDIKQFLEVLEESEAEKTQKPKRRVKK